MSTSLWLLSFYGPKISSISANAEPYAGILRLSIIARWAPVYFRRQNESSSQYSERPQHVTPDLEMRIVGFNHWATLRTKSYMAAPDGNLPASDQEQ